MELNGILLIEIAILCALETLPEQSCNQTAITHVNLCTVLTKLIDGSQNFQVPMGLEWRRHDTPDRTSPISKLMVSQEEEDVLKLNHVLRIKPKAQVISFNADYENVNNTDNVFCSFG